MDRALSQEQKRILDALKKKSTSEGYDFGDKYAKSMLQNNNWKLVATLEAIKADINTRMSHTLSSSIHHSGYKSNNPVLSRRDQIRQVDGVRPMLPG